MITLITNKFNNINQKIYDNFIENLNLASLQCTCGMKGCLTRHAFYIRFVKNDNGKEELSVLRVICSVCKKSHAILLDSIVPYSQILMKDQIQIVINYEKHNNQENIMEENLDIDESNISYILQNYKRKWRERLRSLTTNMMSLLDHPPQLISACFKNFNFNFMQIHCTPNISNPSTT